MKPEGVARLWGFGNAEGPLPEAYEPWESPLDRNIMSGQKINPCAFVGKWMNEQELPTNILMYAQPIAAPNTGRQVS